MDKQERIYVGNGKEFGDYGGVNLSICLSNLPKEHVFEYNGKKYIKLKVGKRKEVNEYGKTHYVEVDTYKPEEKTEEIPKASEPIVDPDDLPF
jgi:hypothetical protein